MTEVGESLRGPPVAQPLRAVSDSQCGTFPAGRTSSKSLISDFDLFKLNESPEKGYVVKNF